MLAVVTASTAQDRALVFRNREARCAKHRLDRRAILLLEAARVGGQPAVDRGVEFLVDMMDDDRTAATRKVLVTGQAQLEDTIVAVNEADLDHYIAKPWDRADLEATVRDQLTSYVADMGIDPLPHLAALDQARADGRRFAIRMAEPIAVPVMQVHGGADRTVVARAAAHSHRHVTGPHRFVRFDRVGHFPHEEVPDRVTDEVLDWLDDPDTSSDQNTARELQLVRAALHGLLDYAMVDDPWPVVGALLLEPSVFTGLAESLVPSDGPRLLSLAESLSDPAATLCRVLAATARPTSTPSGENCAD